MTTLKLTSVTSSAYKLPGAIKVNDVTMLTKFMLINAAVYMDIPAGRISTVFKTGSLHRPLARQALALR